MQVGSATVSLLRHFVMRHVTPFRVTPLRSAACTRFRQTSVRSPTPCDVISCCALARTQISLQIIVQYTCNTTAGNRTKRRLSVCVDDEAIQNLAILPPAVTGLRGPLVGSLETKRLRGRRHTLTTSKMKAASRVRGRNGIQ
jgi:hypothetical protein